MSIILDPAKRFFEASETGKGWADSCRLGLKVTKHSPRTTVARILSVASMYIY
jgi:hypothetical protein